MLTFAGILSFKPPISTERKKACHWIFISDSDFSYTGENGSKVVTDISKHPRPCLVELCSDRTGLQQGESSSALRKESLDSPPLKTALHQPLSQDFTMKTISHYQQIKTPVTSCQPSSREHFPPLQHPVPIHLHQQSVPSLPTLAALQPALAVTWWPHGPWGSPWSGQSSHDGVDDGGGQLGFSICSKSRVSVRS